MKQLKINIMKNLIITSVLLALSALAQQPSFCQSNATGNYGSDTGIQEFPGNSRTEVNCQDNKNKVFEMNQGNISISDLQYELLNMPDANERKVMPRLSENEYSTGEKDYTASVLIGSGIGLACGIIADILYYSYKSYGEKNSPRNFGEMFSSLAPDPVPSAPMILIPVGSALFGALIGAAVAPEKTVKIEMYGKNAGKRKTNDGKSPGHNVSGL